MQRQSSTNSIDNLLDRTTDDVADLDSSFCCSDGEDVFDPPAWRPGRFLQFADIDLTAEDEPSVRPVSLLPTGPLGPAGRCVSAGGRERFESGWEVESGRGSSSSSGSSGGSFVVQVDMEHMLCLRHWRPSLSRRTVVLLASCMTVALTALTLLSFMLY